LVRSFVAVGAEVIVADGSLRTARRIERLATTSGATYVGAPLQPIFSPGVARDAGVQVATREYVLLFDVDLAFSQDFLLRVGETLRGESRPPYTFQMAPCLYLTRGATRQVEADPDKISAIWQSYLRGRFLGVINLAVASSALIIRRDHFLAIGGHRSEYAGHGCEDLDLIFRLTQEWPIGQWGDDLYDDVRQESIADSRGFRKYFSYYGLNEAFSGLVLAHRWHSRPMFSRYFRSRPRNNHLLQKFMRSYRMHGQGPPALSDLTVQEHTLVITAADIDDVQAFRQFLPGMGRHVVTKSYDPIPDEGFSQLFFIGTIPPAAGLCGDKLPSSIRRIGALFRPNPESHTWRLLWWDITGATLRDELHCATIRYYGDGRSYRWLFHQAINRLTGSVLYDFPPPNFSEMDLPPLPDYIRHLMARANLDPSEYPGMFMNQWAQATRYDRFVRKFRKLLRDPEAFWRDSHLRVGLPWGDRK
jgi:predicted glycosyltransferase involved in capsule biosynthesis